MNLFELIYGKPRDNLIDSGIFNIIGNKEMLFYIDTPYIKTIQDVYTEYQYYDIRPTDIVLDIGACIGAFSLKIRNKVNKVYAVEPIMTEQLTKHIQLNKANNITILPYALGNGIITINQMFTDITKHVQGYSLSELIAMSGGYVDFLKCDCEGGEWNIKENELQNIRRIEMEVHLNDIHSNSSYFDTILTNNGFTYTKKYLTDNELIISARKS